MITLTILGFDQKFLPAHKASRAPEEHSWGAQQRQCSPSSSDTRPCTRAANTAAMGSRVEGRALQEASTMVQAGHGHPYSMARPKLNFYCHETAGCAACAWRCIEGEKYLMERDIAKSHGQCTAASPKLWWGSSAIGIEVYHDQLYNSGNL